MHPKLRRQSNSSISVLSLMLGVSGGILDGETTNICFGRQGHRGVVFTFTCSVTVVEDRVQHSVVGSHDSSNMHAYLNDLVNKTKVLE